MNKFYKNKKIVIISMLILFGISSHAQINRKVNTKISTRNIKYNNIKVENNIPLLIATNKYIAKSISSKKINKKLAIKTAKSFNEKIPKDYRPSPGKLYRKLTAQKPFYNNAYLEYRGNYKPMNRYVKIGSMGVQDYWQFIDYLYIKFKPKMNKNYLINLKVKIDEENVEGLRSFDHAIMYVSIGTTTGHSFALDRVGSKLKAKNYEFEFVVRSETYNWIQIPIYSYFNISTDSSNVFPWSFVSATISEL